MSEKKVKDIHFIPIDMEDIHFVPIDGETIRSWQQIIADAHDPKKQQDLIDRGLLYIPPENKEER